MIKTALFAVALTGLTVVSCGGNDKKGKVITTEDTNPKIETQKIGELKIAYYDQDSMKANFEYFKQQDAIVTKKQLAFQKELEKRRKAMESYYNTFMTRAQNNELSQIDSENYQRNLQIQEQELMKYQETEGTRIEKETMEKLEVIGNKIESFSKKYCEEHGIDILMIYVKGGPFNYISSKMDVTKEFTAYLNQNEEAIQKEIKKK